MEKQKALIYCRVSSEKQVRNGDGNGSQEQRCRTYANSNGYQVVKVFPEEGVSGALFERPAMRALIKYLDAHPFEKYVVIFDDLSRFARDVVVHLKLKTEFISRGVELKCLNYNFDDSPEGEYVELILAGGAELQRKQNKRQVIQKMKARLERGYYCFSAVPCGMEYKKTAEHGLLLHHKEPAAGVIKDALEGFANDRFLMQSDVLNFLLQHKDELGKNKGVNLNFVKRILTSIVYAGYIEYEPWEVKRTKGHHEPLVSLDIYEKIQAKLGKPEKKVTERDNDEFPLKGLVCCSVCGEKMKGSFHPNKKKIYHPHYFCTTKGCTAKPRNIKRPALEKEYKDLLTRITPESEIIDFAGVIALDVWRKSTCGIEATEKATEKEIKTKERQIDAYVDLMPTVASDSIRKKYESKIETLENDILALKKQAMPANYLNCEEAISDVLHFLGTPADYWEKTNLEGKFMLHNLIFTANPKYNDQNKFGTPEISLPFTIKDAFSSASSRRVDRTGLEPATSSVQMRRSTR